jgi:hypothetical protein
LRSPADHRGSGIAQDDAQLLENVMPHDIGSDELAGDPDKDQQDGCDRE